MTRPAGLLRTTGVVFLCLATWPARAETGKGKAVSEVPCGSEAIDALGRATITIGSGERQIVIELTTERWFLNSRGNGVDLFAAAQAPTADDSRSAPALALEKALRACPLVAAPAGLRIASAALEALSGQPNALKRPLVPMAVAHSPARRDDAITCEMCGTKVDEAREDAIGNCTGHPDYPSCIRANASGYAQLVAVCLRNCRSAPPSVP